VIALDSNIVILLEVITVLLAIPTIATLNRAERKVEGKIKKKIIRCGKHFSLLALFLALGVLFSIAYIVYYPQLVATTVGCKYLDKYYTNTTFMHDVTSVLNNDEGLVCRHIAPTVMCLCEAYNKTCEYYTLYSYNSYKRGEVVGHIGVKVLMNNSGVEQWVELT